jgi:hypothetical protein
MLYFPASISPQSVKQQNAPLPIKNTTLTRIRFERLNLFLLF